MANVKDLDSYDAGKKELSQKACHVAHILRIRAYEQKGLAQLHAGELLSGGYYRARQEAFEESAKLIEQAFSLVTVPDAKKRIVKDLSELVLTEIPDEDKLRQKVAALVLRAGEALREKEE